MSTDAKTPLMSKFSEIAEIVHKRRTCKNFDGRAITKNEIENLIELAIWAPNHRLTEPWTFRVFDQSAILAFKKTLLSDFSTEDRAAYESNLEKMTKAAAVIHITSAIDKDPKVTKENYAACAAGVQNILLGATAMGLLAYWGTGKLMTHPRVQKYLEISDSEDFVGAVWIGFGETPEVKPRKPLSQKLKWMS